MATDLNREQLRTHYKRIQGFIAKERRMREAVLGKSPKLTEKLAECDASMASLQVLGEWIAALLREPSGREAETSASVESQGVLFEITPERRFY